jgi:enoyl-CoA hydratase
MDYHSIIYQREDNIATIMLNRPEKLNTWDFPGQGGMHDEFFSALDQAAKDDDIKVVVIKGAGRGFSAGHDLSTVGFVYGMGTGQPGERRASQRVRLKIDRAWYENHQKLFYFPKVTIAQIHGYCVEEGLILIEECDIAISAEDAQLGHRGQRLGPAGSSIPSLPILILTVGLKRALDLLLTGRLIDGCEAERIGLVTKAVPPDKLEEEVKRMAKSICLLPRDGIAIGKATRHAAYDSMGLNSGFIQGYISHTLFTNLRFEPDEHNFLKERRNKGVKAAFRGRDVRYQGLE